MADNEFKLLDIERENIVVFGGHLRKPYYTTINKHCDRLIMPVGMENGIGQIIFSRRAETNIFYSVPYEN